MIMKHYIHIYGYVFLPKKWTTLYVRNWFPLLAIIIGAGFAGSEHGVLECKKV